MTKYVGAIDQGTTSSRFMIFNREGAIVASARREHRQIYPQPGWVEHDGAEIWRNTQAAINEALAAGGLGARDLAAVGLTNQRETTMCWDKKTGAPLHNAIVWMDMRTDALASRFSASNEWLRERTGLPLATYFSSLKIVWLLETIPGLREKAERGEAAFGTMDAWLIHHLVGRFATDATNASRTQLMDLRTLQWDGEILSLFSIPRVALPQICASSEVYGLCSGALEGVPLAGVVGDQQGALLGQACLSPGDAKNTYGTGCFLLMNIGATPRLSSHGMLTTLAYRLGDAPPVYALEGSVAIAGALVQWLRDNLSLIGSSDEIEALARSVPDNGGVYFAPAFSGLFAPYWRSDARGVIAGLTAHSNKGHLARAALEAAAFQTRDALAAMVEDAGAPIKELRVDGGMAVNELLMQFQADILEREVVRPACIETTALGAAYAAGLAVGYWRDAADIAANWREARRWKPAMAAPERERLLQGWDKAIARAIGWTQ